MKITLPSGAWADLLTPEQLRSGHLRMVNRSISQFNSRIGGTALDMVDGCVAIIVQEWSCTGSDGNTLPVPKDDLASLDDMDPYDYESLVNHEFVAEVSQRIITLRQERISPDDVEDPDSPTEPSAESGLGLREEPSRRKMIASANGIKPKRTSRSRSDGTGTRTK